MKRWHEWNDASHAGCLGRKGEVDAPVQVVLLDVGEELAVGRPAGIGSGAGPRCHVIRPLAEGKCLESIVIIVQGQPDLLQVVGALGAVGRFAHFLHGRQQQGDQDANDGDHDQ